MILKASGTLMQRHASLPSRYAPSADRYATPVNFEEPRNGGYARGLHWPRARYVRSSPRPCICIKQAVILILLSAQTMAMADACRCMLESSAALCNTTGWLLAPFPRVGSAPDTVRTGTLLSRKRHRSHSFLLPPSLRVYCRLHFPQVLTIVSLFPLIRSRSFLISQPDGCHSCS